MQFRQRLLISGFIVSFVLVAALAVLSFVQTDKLWQRVSQAEHAYQVVNSISQLNYELLATDKAVFRFLSLHDSTHHKVFVQSASHLQTEIAALKILTEDNPEHQVHVQQLQGDATLYFSACHSLFEKPVGTLFNLIQTPEFMEMQARRDEIRSLLSKMSETEGRILRVRTAEREDYLRTTTKMMRTLSVIFGVLTILLFSTLLREFGKRLFLQGELQEKLHELQQSKQEMEHIAYATSHDLQEPLRKIQILLDKWLLQLPSQKPEEADVARRVMQSAQRMQALVGELMLLSSLNADATRKHCPLKLYMEAAVSHLEERVNQSQARIHLGILPVVMGYPDQLVLLFRNLLDNSLKFSRKGIIPELQILSHEATGKEMNLPGKHQSQRYYCVSIQDNGIGIDNDQAHKIFGIFRSLNSPQPGSEGHGAGLAICRRIMANHNGFIQAQGTPNEGATIKLFFPIPA
ncbi:MAG: hypothetical protein JST06_06805 [Bacteroidetes bacterium]|nr:hypothetical protein [Bacteroidota bacterium]